MKRAYIIIIAMTQFLASVGIAGHSVLIGYSDNRWDRISVAYVRIESVGDVEGGLGEKRLLLMPIARLAGELECVDGGVMSATVNRSWDSEINEDPKPGTYALVVIVTAANKGIGPEPAKYCVFGGTVAFMPGYKGLVPVDGDPTQLMEKIVEVVQEIQKVKPTGGDLSPIMSIIEPFQKSVQNAAGVKLK